MLYGITEYWEYSEKLMDQWGKKFRFISTIYQPVYHQKQQQYQL